MNLKFRNSFPPTTENAVLDFETTIGHRLPNDYRTFLLKDNGGEQPEPDCFRVETGEITALAVLFPIGVPNDFYDLAGHFKSKQDDLPKHVIPIGLDIGGNTICLAIAGDANGTVLFWDHEVEADQDNDEWENLYFCARNFTEFLDCLYDNGDF